MRYRSKALRQRNFGLPVIDRTLVEQQLVKLCRHLQYLNSHSGPDVN